MGLIYSVSVLFFTFMIFRMYLKKDIRPYMTSRVVTLLTILGLLPYVNTVIIIATLGDAVVKFNEYRNLTKHRKSYDSAGQIMHPHDEMAESDCWSQLCARHGEDVVNKVWSRHLASEFKRKKAPIYISRELYE